jgi:hypothetical protein
MTSGRLAVIADLIAPHLEIARCAILDVGSASGRLLANLRDRGPDHRLDLSPACAAAAARLYGIDVSHDDARRIAGERRSETPSRRASAAPRAGNT